ncbi:MAG: response regulator transcription factor [Anaerolineales bacterium]|nr:response regulator transcription factor [Anaerolineales bacterium]
MTENAQRVRVLLADDHTAVRQGVRQFLEADSGIEIVAEAAGGAEALRLIRARRPHVAVLDIQMPGLTGIEITRAIRAERLPVGVLILTAFDDDPYVQAVLQAGANGYVLKTAEAGDLIEAVKDVHAGRSALDPAIARRLLARMARPASEVQAAAASLTEREIEVLRLAARGYTNKAIGAQLQISDRTVQGHLAKVYDKLRAGSRTEAVMRAVSLGLVRAGCDFRVSD